MTGLKEKIRHRRLSIGSWLSFADLQLAEMMAMAGFEWLVVDMEHTSTSVSEMRALIQVVSLAGAAPFVRVGANDPLAIKRALDAGAVGIVVPMVNSPDEARAAVEAMYYPPRGRRGVGLARAQRYGAGFADYRSGQDHLLSLFVQIEHHRAVERLDAIMAVDGVDGFIVGPYDLSGSLGVPGRFDHPKVVEALAEVERYAATGAKPAGMHVVHSDPERLRGCVKSGYRFIAYGTEMIFLMEKLRDVRATLDGLATSAP
jgi:2-dehydro-3-deoxyglucarate aldolase